MYGSNESQSYISPPVAGSAYPHQSQQMYSTSGIPMQQAVHDNYNWYCSPRHDAIYLVVGRILYEFWHRPLVKSAKMDGPDSPKMVYLIN